MKYIIQQINTPSALTLSVAQEFEVAKKLQRLIIFCCLWTKRNKWKERAHIQMVTIYNPTVNTNSPVLLKRIHPIITLERSRGQGQGRVELTKCM